MKKHFLFGMCAVIFAILFASCSQTTDTATVTATTISADSSGIIESITENTATVKSTLSTNYQGQTVTNSNENPVIKTSAVTVTTEKSANKKQNATQQKTSKKTYAPVKNTTIKKTAAKTTVKATTKPNTTKYKLTQKDVEWVKSKAHEYIRSKGITVDESVSSFSNQISTMNYYSKENLLNVVKESIDGEYAECVQANMLNVHMCVKIENRDNGYHFICVMYG